MSRYIDATRLQKQVELNIELSRLTQDFYDGAMWVLKQIQQFRRSKDVAKVVRCKGCKLRHTEHCFSKHETADNDFCSCGARMDGVE